MLKKLNGHTFPLPPSPQQKKKKKKKNQSKAKWEKIKGN